MRRTCNTCRAVFDDEFAGIRFCANCGDALPKPAPAVAASPPVTVVTPAPESQPSRNTPAAIPLPPPAPPQSKSPGLAALLSFLLVGMGQVYLGQVEKGLLMLGVVLVLMLTIVLGPLGFILLLFNVADAYLLAGKVKRGKPLRKWEFFFSGDKSAAGGAGLR